MLIIQNLHVVQDALLQFNLSFNTLSADNDCKKFNADGTKKKLKLTALFCSVRAVSANW